VFVFRLMDLSTHHAAHSNRDVTCTNSGGGVTSGTVNSIKRLACQAASGTRDKVADLLSRCSFIAIINLSLTGIINSRGTTMNFS
jgi:hypothetical protein